MKRKITWEAPETLHERVPALGAGGARASPSYRGLEATVAETPTQGPAEWLPVGVGGTGLGGSRCTHSQSDPFPCATVTDKQPRAPLSLVSWAAVQTSEKWTWGEVVERHRKGLSGLGGIPTEQPGGAS